MFELDKYQKNIAVITDSREVFTYGDINRMQAELFIHIGKRKLVAVLCENKIGSLLGYVCFMNNSIVPIMLDKNINVILLNNLLNKYQPDYLWVPESYNCFDDYNVKCVLYGYKLIEYSSQRETVMFEQLALLLTTSGTTGSPKLVRLSYNNIKNNTRAIISYLGICESEKAITVLPMNYTYGLSVINTHLYSGACILLTDSKVCEKCFWHFFNEFGGTSFSGVPYTYEVLRKMNFANFTVPSLKMMTQAGGKMLDKVSEYFYDYSINSNRKFYIMYGQTEATARMSYLPFEYMHQKKGSVGIPIKGGTFEIVDDNNIKLKENEIGEIVYKGENVSLGYAFNQYDLEKGDDNKNELFTGDIGYLDSDGFLYLYGRSDRSVKVLGNRIDLDEVEEIILTLFQIQSICVWYEGRIHIVVTKCFQNCIKEKVSKLMGINSKYFVVDVIKKIPRTLSGKIDYKTLMGLVC